MPYLDPYDLELEKIKKRRAISEAIAAQGIQPMGGTETVSGIAVRRSPFEGIAKLMTTYLGKSGTQAADVEAKKLGETRRTDIAKALEEYSKATSPQERSIEMGPKQPSEMSPVGGMQPVGLMTDTGEPVRPPAAPAASVAPMTTTHIPTAAERKQAALMLSSKISDPHEYAKLVVANAFKSDEPIKLGKEETLLEPGTYRQLATGAKGERKTFTDTNGITRYVDTGEQVLSGEMAKAPEGMKYDEKGNLVGIPGYVGMKKDIAAAGRPSTSVEIKQEGAERATVGKGFGDQYIDLQKGALNASSKLNNLDRMSQLMEGVTTGALQPTLADVSAIAQTFGFKIDPNLGPKQAMEALSNEMALQLRNPSGGAGMPGALSDRDVQFLRAMVPGLAKTPEGNKLIIETARKLSQREIQVAQLARDYRKKKGQLDEGFYDQLKVFSDANPLFETGGAGAAGFRRVK